MMDFKNIFLILLLFSFSLNLVNSTDDKVSYCNINLMENSIPLISIGLLVSILFVSIFFMYGKFMSTPEVEGVYMVELQQIGLTMVMIILITGGIEILCSVSLTSEGLLLSDSDNVYTSIQKTQLNLMKKTMDYYISLMDGVNAYSILGSSQAGITGTGLSIMYSPVSGGNFIAQTLAPLGQSVLIAYFAQAFQYALFEFSRSKIFLMLLPIGLVLRSFPITRKFGGVLIALVLGLSYLYPLFLNFGYLFIDIDSIELVSYPDPFDTLTPLSIVLTTVVSPLFSAFPAIFAGVIGGFIAIIFESGSIMDIVDGSGSQIDFLSTFTLTGESFINNLDKIYSSFGTIILGTFFIPALIIIVLGAVVRSLSASIGTETDISGILRAI